MHWVIDVYVCAWARIRSLHLFVARSIVTAAKSCMNCLLGHDLILYIVLLVFLVVVLAGARVLRESLTRVWRLALVLPELTSLRFCQEGLRLLSDELAVGILFQMLLSVILNREGGLVSAWPGKRRLNGSVLAIRHIRLENLVHARRVELLLSQLVEVVDAWTWVIGPGLVVVLIVRLLEQSPIYLTQMELVLRELRVNFGHLRSISCGAYLIEAATCVRCGSQLPGRNTRSDRVRNHRMISMFRRFVLQVCLVDGFQIIPFGCLIVVSRVRSMQVRRTLNKT